MSRANKHDIYKAAMFALLIVFAFCCRFIARNAGNDVIDKFLNFIRTFIYIGCILAWLFSVERRVIQRQTRHILYAVAALMIFWIVIREFKWRFVINTSIIRYLWYFYYIPILCIPMLALLISMSLGESEEYHLPKKVLGLYGVTAFLAVCVLTNDLHQLVFAFPSNSAIWTESECTHGTGYFIVMLWVFLCALAAVAVMIKKCRLPHGKSFVWVPMLSFGISLLYVVLYVADVSFVKVFLGDFAVFQCLVFIGFFESCIRLGFIQSNTGYYNLFHASADTCLQIVDNNYTVCYAENGSKPLPKEQMKLAEERPLVLPNGKRLHNMPVSGGHAIWTEDISELLKLRETLGDRQEELQERFDLLQYEYEREKEHKTVEEQNRLYDLLQSKTQTQLDKIDSLVKLYKKAVTKEEKHKILSNIVVLGSFIKRRKDFVLSVDHTTEIPESKLTNAFDESYRAMKLLGISGSFFVDTGKSYVSGDVLTKAYDFFEDILENVLDKAKFVNVRVCRVKETLRINILTDCTGDFNNLYQKYNNLSIICEDMGETEFVLPLTGGAGV